MSHFYGTITGSRGQVTARGGKNGDIVTQAASYKGCIKVRLYADADGNDCYTVEQTPWQGAGVSRLVAQGRVGEAP